MILFPLCTTKSGLGELQECLSNCSRQLEPLPLLAPPLLPRGLGTRLLLMVGVGCSTNVALTWQLFQLCVPHFFGYAEPYALAPATALLIHQYVQGFFQASRHCWWRMRVIIWSNFTEFPKNYCSEAVKGREGRKILMIIKIKFFFKVKTKHFYIELLSRYIKVNHLLL